MSSNSDDLEAVQRSALATLGEIVDGENAFKRAGIDLSDPDEWMQLRDIVARIERRLMSKINQPMNVDTSNATRAEDAA